MMAIASACVLASVSMSVGCSMMSLTPRLWTYWAVLVLVPGISSDRLLVVSNTFCASGVASQPAKSRAALGWAASLSTHTPLLSTLTGEAAVPLMGAPLAVYFMIDPA